MIVTATLQAVFGVTHRVGRLVPTRTVRVRQVHAMAGGERVNVAGLFAFLARAFRPMNLVTVEVADAPGAHR